MEYKCKRNFTSKEEKEYCKGDVISEEEFELLMFDDQENFEIINQDSLV